MKRSRRIARGTLDHHETAGTLSLSLYNAAQAASTTRVSRGCHTYEMKARTPPDVAQKTNLVI